MPAYVYILRCADGRNYTGLASDLKQRLQQQHQGKVRSTQGRLPARLMYFDEHETLPQARQRERALRNGRTRRATMYYMIRTFPAERPAPLACLARRGL
jgi:putative endonuclease